MQLARVELALPASANALPAGGRGRRHPALHPRGAGPGDRHGAAGHRPVPCPRRADLVAAALGAGIVANLAAFIAGSRLGLITGSAVLVLAYGSIGLLFLRQSDQDWEHRAATATPA
jgi:hypothetical protein